MEPLRFARHCRRVQRRRDTASAIAHVARAPHIHNRGGRPNTPGWTMTTVREIALRCPVCATWFQSAAMDQASGYARTSTDFHRRIDGAEPVAYEVDLCTACGYAGPRDDFASDEMTATSAAALEAP